MRFPKLFICHENQSGLESTIWSLLVCSVLALFNIENAFYVSFGIKLHFYYYYYLKNVCLKIEIFCAKTEKKICKFWFNQYSDSSDYIFEYCTVVSHSYDLSSLKNKPKTAATLIFEFIEGYA